MKNNSKTRICPVEKAGTLDRKMRRWIQNPRKILKPYLKQGMTALDYGCGPGFFTVDMAQMVGESGQIIAADLQDGMLQKLKGKIHDTKLENRVLLHKCEEDRINLSKHVDFILAFYIIHEVIDKDAIFVVLE